jgi:hypothetical protein
MDNIEVARSRSAQNCYQGLREACGDAALPYCTVARWVKLFHSGQLSFRMTPCWRRHNSAPCFFTGCRSSVGCTGVNCWDRRISQNHSPHSVCHSWIPQNCSALVPHTISEVRLPWMDRHSGHNFGSLMWTTLEVTIKWLDASCPLLSEESVRYTE